MTDQEDFNRGVFQGAVLTELKELRSVFTEHVLEDRRTAKNIGETMEKIQESVEDFQSWRNKLVAFWGGIGVVAGTLMGFLFDWLKLK